MRLLMLGLIFLMMIGCQGKSPDLPFIGDREELDGTVTKHEIRPYQLTNHLGTPVTNATYKGRIQVVDFFFTSCPSICPKVAAQMKRIQDHVSGEDDVILLSHTIDPKRDSVSILNQYATKIGADDDLWHFLTGSKDLIMDLANEDYFVAALEAPDAPGGFDHSGKILLLDHDARIRGFCDGTDPKTVDAFMDKIDILRKQHE